MPLPQNNKLFRHRQQQIVQIVYANIANCTPAATEAGRFKEPGITALRIRSVAIAI